MILNNSPAIYLNGKPIKQIYNDGKQVWPGDMLPPGYTKLASLTATDPSQYIITDIMIDKIADVIVQLKGSCDKISGCGLFGARVQANINTFALVHRTGTNTTKPYYLPRPYDTRVTNNDDQASILLNGQNAEIVFHVELNNCYAIESNGSIVRSNTRTATGANSIPYPIMLFAVNNSGTVSNNNGNRCIYYFKLWKSGLLVHNLLPALDSENIPCMYDTITKKTYYSNSGLMKFEKI